LIALLRYRILNLLRRFAFHLYDGICLWVFALLTSDFVVRGLSTHAYGLYKYIKLRPCRLKVSWPVNVQHQLQFQQAD